MYTTKRESAMSDVTAIQSTWEKILEYASSPVQGTMSRKLRKGVKIQINSDVVIADAQIFISDTFVRFTFSKAAKEVNNLYYDLSKIVSIHTISSDSE
jgi:hypothetical protein